MVWALYVLCIRFQYYAATWNLTTNSEWTFMTFASPLILAGLIFLAAGLDLPIGQGAYPPNLQI